MPSSAHAVEKLEAFDKDSGDLNVIIETPKGSRNKFKFAEKHSLFQLGSVLPAGASFPFDFGFIPSTKGEDGDPLDVLVLMDQAAFPGCLVCARLIGVIEAEQSEERKIIRNDRLIAVASESRDHREIYSIKELNENLVNEIEHFFVSYNQMRGKTFEPLGRYGPKRAQRLVKEGIKNVRPAQKSSSRSARKNESS